MNKPLESDWKKYCALVTVVRERYLGKCNAKAAALLTDPRRNETERFWDTMDLMEKDARVIQLCLDRHARSQMVFSMLALLSHGLMTKEELSTFSEELQASLAYVFDEPKGKG